MLSDDYFEDLALELEREFPRESKDSVDHSTCRLFIPSDWPDSARPDTDVFSEPLISGAWYWGWEERVETEGQYDWDILLHIESGPVSPLTFERDKEPIF